jgi:hypothetical protein
MSFLSHCSIEKKDGTFVGFSGNLVQRKFDDLWERKNRPESLSIRNETIINAVLFIMCVYSQYFWK